MRRHRSSELGERFEQPAVRPGDKGKQEVSSPAGGGVVDERLEAALVGACRGQRSREGAVEGVGGGGLAGGCGE